MGRPLQFAFHAHAAKRPVCSFNHAFRLALAVAALFAAGHLTYARAQSAGPPVGRIEGDDISVRGEVQMNREKGATFTSLSSGAQVTVRSGGARIELSGGGEIGICGPARFSLVRSGSSLTLALDYGRVRARLDPGQDFRVYTPMVQASPISSPGHTGELSVGLEESGKMCVHPAGGALRLEPQFGGDSIVVPQDMGATLEEGRLVGLAEGGASCACDALNARRKPGGPDTGLQASITLPSAAAPAENEEVKKAPAPQAPPAPFEQPIWKVYMPPLSFDATSPTGEPQPAKASAMPPPSAETALLFREVYAEPVIRLSGVVTEPPPKEAPAGKAAADNPAEKKPSFAARIGNFFRRLFGGKSKEKEQPAQNAEQLRPPAGIAGYMPS